MSKPEQQSEFSENQKKENKDKSDKDFEKDNLSGEEEPPKGVIDYYIAALEKYGEGSGRATRKEFWSFLGCDLVIGLVLRLINPGIGLLYGLATLAPRLAVAVRRLHDTDHSGWLLLLVFIPFVNIVGAIFLLFLLLQDSDDEKNQYGPNPKEKS